MVVLAVTVIVLLPRADVGAVRVTNLAIWGVFVIDYFTRLALSGDRRRFLRRNVIDLIAILPADIFRAARALRVVRVLARRPRYRTRTSPGSHPCKSQNS